MEKLFISLSENAPAGFASDRPDLQNLGDKLVALFADTLDTAYEAGFSKLDTFRGILITREDQYRRTRIKPGCVHMAVTEDMLPTLRHWAGALLEEMHDHEPSNADSKCRGTDLESMAELLPLCVFEADERMQVKYANRLAIDSLGYSQTDIREGLSGFDMVAPDDRDRAEDNQKKRIAGLTAGPVEYLARKKDGSTFPVLFNISPIRKDGRVSGYCGGFIDISEWKSALQQSKALFSLAFESSPSVMCILDLADGRTLEANHAFCSMLGLDRKEAIGKTMRELGLCCRDEEEDVREQFLRDGYDRKIEVEFKAEDGLMRTALFGGRMLKLDGSDCLLLSGEDTTQRNRISRALKESEQMLKLVMNSIPQFIFWKDRDSVYLGCNENFARVAGVGTPENIIGKTDFDLAWKTEEAKFFRKVDREVIASKQPRFHIIEPQFQAEGKEAWLDTNKIPLTDEHGEVVGILGTFEDITERRKSEQELRETNEKLNKTVAELDRFVYSASHDLGAPLKSILGLIHIAQKDTDTDRTADYLSYIEGSVHKLEEVIKSLISYSRNARLDIKKDSFVFGDIIGEIRAELAYLPSADKVRFHFVRGQKTTLTTDRQRLKLILHNLINNSMKYTDKDKAHPEIQLSMVKRRRYFHISVRDNGVGIDRDEIGNIFNMFYRGTEQSEGTGLGLYIVKETVRTLGGDITVESARGKFSEFVVKIPIG